MTPRKRRKVTVFRVVMVLLLIAGCAFAIYRLRLRSKLNARIEAIRADGYPVTCAELNKWYSIPDDVENAAYTIEEAFFFHKEWSKKESGALPLFGKAELPARSESLPAETKALIAEYIADNNEALELLHAGAAIENCRYPIDLSQGFYMLAPESLSLMRNAIRLLALEAILYAENGDSKSAVRSTISGFGIAGSLYRQPTTISQIIRALCQFDAISTVEQVTNRVQLTDEQLVLLTSHVRESERICNVSCALIGQRCVGMDFFRNPDFRSDRPPIGLAVAFYEAIGRADAGAIIYLDLIDEYMKATELPLHERQEAARAVDARFRAIPKSRWILHEVMPIFSRTVTANLRAIARLRGAYVALAVQLCRLAGDKLPDKLADLVPTYLESIPQDPFDGNYLRYRTLDPGSVVYSIGEDLSDDGGKERPSKARGQESANWDVTFIIER
jgi:hypothetical protein